MSETPQAKKIRLTVNELAAAVQDRDAKIADLEARLADNQTVIDASDDLTAAYLAGYGAAQKRIGKLEEALRKIANGEGTYGAQADHEACILATNEPAEPSISAAETVLAALDPEALRPILSRLANDTPATCYYSKDFGESMRALPEKAATEAGKMPPLEQGLMFVAATAADRLAPGDKLDAEFTSIMHGAQDVGSYRVRIERLATKETSDE